MPRVVFVCTGNICRSSDADVEDPYYGGPDGFVEMFDVIERAMPALLRHCRGLVSG